MWALLLTCDARSGNTGPSVSWFGWSKLPRRSPGHVRRTLTVEWYLCPHHPNRHRQLPAPHHQNSQKSARQDGLSRACKLTDRRQIRPASAPQQRRAARLEQRRKRCQTRSTTPPRLGRPGPPQGKTVETTLVDSRRPTGYNKVQPRREPRISPASTSAQCKKGRTPTLGQRRRPPTDVAAPFEPEHSPIDRAASPQPTTTQRHRPGSSRIASVVNPPDWRLRAVSHSVESGPKTFASATMGRSIITGGVNRYLRCRLTGEHSCSCRPITPDRHDNVDRSLCWAGSRHPVHRLGLPRGRIGGGAHCRRQARTFVSDRHVPDVRASAIPGGGVGVALDRLT